MAENKHKQTFAIKRIYLKDLSFEAPLGADAFVEKWQPAINQELNLNTKKIRDDHYEVTLRVTLTARIEEKTAFLVEIHQAGLFLISGIPDAKLPQLLNNLCPNILLPYIREAIDSVVVKGTFPAIMLSPINFEALYVQAMEKQQMDNRQEEQDSVKIH